jgi:hypothetical protein
MHIYLPLSCDVGSTIRHLKFYFIIYLVTLPVVELV